MFLPRNTILEQGGRRWRSRSRPSAAGRERLVPGKLLSPTVHAALPTRAYLGITDPRAVEIKRLPRKGNWLLTITGGVASTAYRTVTEFRNENVRLVKEHGCKRTPRTPLCHRDIFEPKIAELSGPHDGQRSTAVTLVRPLFGVQSNCRSGITTCPIDINPCASSSLHSYHARGPR